MSQKFDLKQGQDLVMTPQLQQAIKLLQLSNIELTEFVEEELENNPLLEKDNRERDQEQSADGDDQPETSQSKDEIQEEFDSSYDEEPGTASQNDFDAGSSMASVGAGGSYNFDDAEQSFENRMSRPQTLRDHLTEQLHMAFDDPRDHLVGALLIDMLDESGYLRHDLDELPERFGCSAERLDRLLGKMKQFDPSGVFASGLPECLAIQLDEKNSLDEPMQKLLDHLDMVASYDFPKLADLCGVNETYLQDMLEEIRALNPKPAGDFDHLVVQTAIPDVLMKRLPKNLGGGWRVELNNETLPKVLINQSYYTEVAKVATQKKDKDYLNEKIQSANWLVKALDQRAKTILKVASAIIEQQEGFFLYGIEYMKPMTLRDIAEEIEMHESTVSRVTNNKYIGTPRGILELKFFFSTALNADNKAGGHSAEAVRAKIKNMIDAEDPKKILSDDKIVTMLQEQNIDIARRTVAKYREAMNIPSSVQRRKQKKNKL